MLAGRRTAALDDNGEIAGGELGCLKCTDDLEACWIAQTHQDALGIVRRARVQHARPRQCDRSVINDTLGGHLSLQCGGYGNAPALVR